MKDNSDNYTPNGEDNLDNLKEMDLIDYLIDDNSYLTLFERSLHVRLKTR